MAANATNGGHVSRALDFYSLAKESGYFIIGGTEPWRNTAGEIDEDNPATVLATDFKLNGVVGLKKVEKCRLVIKAPADATEGEYDIQYRDNKWKYVEGRIDTTVGSAGVSLGSYEVPVTSVAGLSKGSKIRVANLYEGKITDINGTRLTLDTAAPAGVSANSAVLGGALVEGAKYVYLDCYLNYDEFPLAEYRQIGLCTDVVPLSTMSSTERDILRSADYSSRDIDEWESLGILEILDNRVRSLRDISQREQLSIIIEF